MTAAPERFVRIDAALGTRPRWPLRVAAGAARAARWLRPRRRSAPAAALARRAAAARARDADGARAAAARARRRRPVRARACCSPRAGCARSTTVPLGERPVRPLRELPAGARRARIPTCWCWCPRRCAKALGWSAPARRRGGRRGEGRQEEAEQGHPGRGGARGDRASRTTTSARGRGKVVVIHPAERMNADRRQRLPEDARGAGRRRPLRALHRRARRPAADDPQPLPGDRASRCRRSRGRDGLAARAGRGASPRCCSPAAAASRRTCWRWPQLGVDAAAWRALPGRVAAGDASALRGWPLPLAVETLQKLCHDAASVACGARAALLRRRDAAAPAPELGALLRWCARAGARRRSTPSIRGTPSSALESLVEQGREALKTPRSARRRGEVDSLHLRR